MEARANRSPAYPSAEVSKLPDIVLADADATSFDEILRDALRAIRVHLGMDVAFVSEFSNGKRIFRHVDSRMDNPPIRVGDSNPLDESYCQRIVDGRLPELIRDAALVPAALELPVTTALPVGAHLSVPIRLADGTIYGTFCCFSVTPDPSLQERDLAMMRVFGDFAAKQIDRQLAADRARDEIRERIGSVLDDGRLNIVYQPVYHFEEDRVVGFEALTRFSAMPIRTPDVWFKEAAQVGLGEALEMAAIEAALRGLDRLPKDIYIAVNISPENVTSGAVARALAGKALDRIVLEVTEHVAIADYARFAAMLAPLRQKGLRLAVDDAGAGYASFRHILKLQPDFIKLDISITRDIDTDRTRRALAAALIRFTEETGSVIIAEGVETDSELDVLRRLHVNKAQGYFIGRPTPIESATALLNLRMKSNI